MSRRLLLLGSVLCIGVGVGVVSVRQIGDQIAVLDACEAADSGRWQATLAGTAGRVGTSATGRAAAQCRCRALLAIGEKDACAELLEGILEAPQSGDWAPSPALSVHLIQTRRDAGRTADAARLARRAARAHPHDADLFFLELATRSAVEDETAVMAELADRLVERGPAAVRMRVSLANRHLMRGDPQAALATLGAVPPRGAGESVGLWFETVGMAQANAGDLSGVEHTYSRWLAVGGDADELAARYAFTLSIAHLEGRESTLTLLERAVANGPYPPALEESLTIRLVLGLASNGRTDEALLAYDQGRERFALEGLTREELLRSASHRRLQDAGVGQPGATLHFALTQTVPGAQLLVSPPLDAPVDTPFEVFEPTRSGAWQVERRGGVAPVRWVLRGAQGSVLASGTLSPGSGARMRVGIAPRAPLSPRPATLTRVTGDGHRRVALILLDCADWRIIHYLIARGELPVLEALLARGHRAVLGSEPPLTAAALEALVWPERSSAPSFVGLIHRFGLELAGLSSIGDNPFAALEWVLPDTPGLFDVVGAGDHVAANLLFAHGGIDAGRHGELTGPNGRKRQLEIGAAVRDLDADERARFPALAAVRKERDAVHLRTIAAEFDAANEVMTAREVDLLALRIESLDILTHGHFAATTRDGQDDAAGLLYAVYRYIDFRLGALHDRLDEDDVLIVMSDHGIRTSMEHSPLAFFVADGAGIAHGRSLGEPAIAGVSRSLAELVGVSTDWPDTGVGPWTRTAGSAIR